MVSAPLVGPALGPILGGALTQGFDWRATFYFLAIIMGVCLTAFLTFKDTFRRERSLTYQLVLRRVRAQQEAARRSETSTMSHVTAVEREDDETVHQRTISEPKTADSDGKRERQRITFQDVEAQTPSADGVRLTEVKLSLKDVNPIPPMWAVLRRPNNLTILFASGVF